MGEVGSAPVRVIIADPEAESGDELRDHLLNVGKGRSFEFRFVRNAGELRRAHRAYPARLVVADEAVPREDPAVLSSLPGATVWVAIGDFAAAREAGWSAGAACVLVKPVARQQVAEALEELEEAPVPADAADSTGFADVLVVDDDPAACEHLARALHEQGYTVQACLTGAEAVARIVKEAYRGAVIDLVLPDADGFNLARVIRSDPRHRNIPVIAMTETADSNLIVRAARAGVADVLLKPVVAATLLEKLKRLIGSGSRR